MFGSSNQINASTTFSKSKISTFSQCNVNFKYLPTSIYIVCVEYSRVGTGQETANT